MVDDVGDIAAFYGEDPDREHGRLNVHQLEHELTWRFLEEHLPPDGSVLELGCATGTYTLELARRGYVVTAVDLASGLVDQARARCAEAELDTQARFYVADARDLSAVPGIEFDAVLMMGPLYHLVHAEDRDAALTQAVARLRAGGLMFSVMLARLGVLGDLLRNNPAWIEDRAHVRSLLERGRRPDDAPRGGFRGYFARSSEVAPLHEAAGLQTVTLAGLEPAISAWDESFNALEGRQRSLWLDLLHEISTEASVVEASKHLLYVGRKPAPSAEVAVT